MATLASATAQASALTALQGCPNTDDEYRTGNAQCVFSCGGHDRLGVTASSNENLEEITGKATCGGAVAECVERSSDGCNGGSSGLTTRAQSEGACKATGFDPWWAGNYELTVDCSSTWVRESPVLCSLLTMPDCEGNDAGSSIRMRAVVVDGRVADLSGTSTRDGVTSSFVPTLLLEDALGGVLVTLST